MESFIGPGVEQSRSKISLHLDAYIQETLDIYKEHPATKMIRPKSTPMQQGNVLSSAGDKQRQAFYRSMAARLQFAQRG